MTKANIAAICDLDGLLVDSEPLHFVAYKEVLGKYGIDLTKEMFISGWLSGKHYGTTYHLEKVGIVDPEKVNEIRNEKSDKFIEIATGKLDLMPGAADFLKELGRSGIRCGVGTGGHTKEYEFIREECGLGEYVEVFVGGDDVPKNKPAPDIFLKVVSELGVVPENCLVFENSDIGMHSGVAAGMKCIVIPSPYTKGQDFTGAHKVLSSLADVDLNTFPCDL